MNRPDPATTAVLRGADSGLYDLPTEIAQLRAARDHLTAELNRPAPDRNAARADYLRAVRAAALAGQPVPDPTPLLDLEQEAAAHTHRQQIVQRVHDELTGDLNGAVSDLAEPILLRHIRPAWQRAYDQARQAAALFLPHGTTQGALFAAPEKARKAFVTFGEHIDTMRRCVAVVDGLRLRGYKPQLDELDLFRSVADVPAVWPSLATDRRTASQTLTLKPWPDDYAERVIWAVQNNVDLWLPTPHEQDQQWNRVYGERVTEQARGRWAAQAMHSLSGTSAGGTPDAA